MRLDLILLLSFLFFGRLLHGGFLHCLVSILVVLDEVTLVHIYQFFQVILHVSYISLYLIQVAMAVFYSGVLVFN